MQIATTLVEYYHKRYSADNDEGRNESEYDSGILMLKKKKIKVNNGWRFWSTPRTGRIVMMLQYILSSVGRDAGADTNKYLYYHADTWMVGAVSIMMYTLDMECKFYYYSSEYEPQIVPLVNDVTKYDHPYGNTYILRVNQYLWIIE